MPRHGIDLTSWSCRIIRFLRWRTNPPLIIGAVLVALVTIAAVFGPRLAPHDPLAELNIIQVDTTWITPPFAAFEVPGYPLGSDVFGRDLFSRLLWGIGPTMTMVVIVAAVRLVFGVTLGLISGWSDGRVSFLLTSITSAALSIPTLIVSLVAIAAIGVEWGIWAFVIGLSLTGWAESAQAVREKTRELRGAQFVEAARALGANSFEMLFGHILRHVMPMVWMRMAFEVGNTLTVTSALGFLGYFIGGDVWIEVGDFVARRTSGTPELGQMLATAQVNVLEPWAMLAVGSAVFVTVLGFNLLGEGLRRRLALVVVTRRTLYAVLISDVVPWVAEHVTGPARMWVRHHPIASSGVGLVIVAAALGLIVWEVPAGAGPGDMLHMTHALWASDWHDAYGTMQTEAVGPASPEVLWTFQAPGGLRGGPAIAGDGTLYLGAGDGTVYALSPSADVIWSTSLLTGVVGAPALGENAQVYFADLAGAITAVSVDGSILWRYQPDVVRKASSGPIVGPDGIIYLGFGSNLQAVSPQGELVWYQATPYGLYIHPPQMSSDGAWVYRSDLVVATDTGDPAIWPATDGVDGYITGGDGGAYSRSGHVVMTLDMTDGAAEVLETTRWDSAAFTFAMPGYAGVTAERVIWLAYTSLRNNTIVWLSPDGHVFNQARTPALRRSDLVGMDGETTAYLCGQRLSKALVCFALTMDDAEPSWQLELGVDDVYAGGAIARDRVYVATSEGMLFALGDQE